MKQSPKDKKEIAKTIAMAKELLARMDQALKEEVLYEKSGSVQSNG